jgi:hypothetical protein
VPIAPVGAFAEEAPRARADKRVLISFAARQLRRRGSSSPSQHANYAEEALLQRLVGYLPLFHDEIGSWQGIFETQDTPLQVQLAPCAIGKDSLEPAAPPLSRRFRSNSVDAIVTGDQARPLDRLTTVLTEEHDCVVAIVSQLATLRTSERLLVRIQVAAVLLNE